MTITATADARSTVVATPADWAGDHRGFVPAGPSEPDGIETAHRQTRLMRLTSIGGEPTPGPTLPPVTPIVRQDREELELTTLTCGATIAEGAGDRAVPEDPDSYRTCFERDRDRIVHAEAFRRLAGKTQVFIFPDDHQRTRLTHALEVAQVAVGIARAAGLNRDLTEAIALAHDCGHGPGGHASEEALSPYLSTGFDHAVWGADVVGVPLNLCSQTLDGIRNHSWSRPAPRTAEAEVVSWADRIAYVCHDFEDACTAGILNPDDLPDTVREACGPRRSNQIDTFIKGTVDVIVDNGIVGMETGLAGVLGSFRRFNYERIYMRQDSIAERQAVIAVLRALVDHRIESGTPAIEAVGWVAAMTDLQACQLAVERLHWRPDRLPAAMRSPLR